MKKIMILIEDLYQEMEAWYPYYRMKEQGFEVTVAGPEKRVYKSKLGYPMEAESIEDFKADDFDAVIIPGGYAPDRLRKHESILNFVRKMNEQNKVVAAICHAGWVLASADILKGKKGTCYIAIVDDMKNAGMEYVDEEVVLDGNLITSREPDDLPAFCKAIIEKLE